MMERIKDSYDNSCQTSQPTVFKTNCKQTQRRRQWERHQTKASLSRTLAVSVCYKSLHIFLPFSATETGERGMKKVLPTLRNVNDEG